MKRLLHITANRELHQIIHRSIIDIEIYIFLYTLYTT